MRRASLVPAVVLVLLAGGLPAAEPVKDRAAKKAARATPATITRVDPKKGTLTVQMKDPSGKNVERMFRLTGDVRYYDSAGRNATVDAFQVGNEILVVQEKGKLKEVHQPKAPPKGGKKTEKKPTESKPPQKRFKDK